MLCGPLCDTSPLGLRPCPRLRLRLRWCRCACDCDCDCSPLSVVPPTPPTTLLEFGRVRTFQGGWPLCPPPPLRHVTRPTPAHLHPVSAPGHQWGMSVCGTCGHTAPGCGCQRTGWAKLRSAVEGGALTAYVRRLCVVQKVNEICVLQGRTAAGAGRAAPPVSPEPGCVTNCALPPRAAPSVATPSR